MRGISPATSFNTPIIPPPLSHVNNKTPTKQPQYYIKTPNPNPANKFAIATPLCYPTPGHWKLSCAGITEPMSNHGEVKRMYQLLSLLLGILAVAYIECLIAEIIESKKKEKGPPEQE